MKGFVSDECSDRAVATVGTDLGGGRALLYARSDDISPSLTLTWMVPGDVSLFAWRRRQTTNCERCGCQNRQIHLLEFVDDAGETVAWTAQDEPLDHLCTAAEREEDEEWTDDE